MQLALYIGMKLLRSLGLSVSGCVLGFVLMACFVGDDVLHYEVVDASFFSDVSDDAVWTSESDWSVTRYSGDSQTRILVSLSSPGAVVDIDLPLVLEDAIEGDTTTATGSISGTRGEYFGDLSVRVLSVTDDTATIEVLGDLPRARFDAGGSATTVQVAAQFEVESEGCL